MKYDIYSEDVVDNLQESTDNKDSQPKIRYKDVEKFKSPMNKSKSRNKLENNDESKNYIRKFIITLHIALIFGVVLLIYFVVVSPFIFEESSDFQLTGELSNFTTSLNQTLELNAKEYELSIDGRTNLAGDKEEFTFYNFTGELFLQNDTLTLIGTTPFIETRSSTIDAKEQQIILSFQKGGVQLFLKNISMTISDKLDITYSPDLIYSTEESTEIIIQEFKGTFSQDTLIGLRGNVDSFSIENNNSKLHFD